MIPKTAPTGSSAPVRAALSLLALAAAAMSAPALGGSVLVSRESGLRASGASAAGEYNLSNGSGDFDLFTDNLRSDDTASAAARSMAQQHSQPRLDGAGAFGGALANGAVRAAVDASASDAYSSAESDFDIVFQVTGEPARVLLQCSMGAAGDATAGLKLYDVQTLDSNFADEVSGDSRQFSGEQTLKPGVYGLSVWAFVRGTPADSSATYDINLSLASAAQDPPPVNPVPLPSGAWAGLAAMAVVGGTAMRFRRRAAR